MEVVENLDSRINDIVSSDIYSEFSDQDKKIALELIRQNDVELIDSLWRLHHKFRPVSIDEFLVEYYMGNSAKFIYPIWKENLREIFDYKNGIQEVILSGAVGTGKTTVAIFSIAYFFR